MLNVPLNELYWIAGFLEGEGSFTRCGGTIAVNASQVQREPLDRLQKLLSGSINRYMRDEIKGFFYYRWQIYGIKAEELMKILFPIMSPKRQNQISLALAWYASRPGRNFRKSGRTTCRSGLHQWVPENIEEVYGARYCRICKVKSEIRKRDKIKQSRIGKLMLN